MQCEISKNCFALALILIAPLLIPVPAHASCEKTQLHDSMEAMKKAYKGLREAAKDDDWMTITAARTKMQELTAAGRKEQPLKLKDIAPEQHPKFLEEYQEGMNILEANLDRLAATEAEKDIEAARALVEEIGKHSKESHKTFKKDCK